MRVLRFAVFCGIIAVLATIPAWVSGYSQQLSFDVYPSEDELLEALQAGEIGYAQYVILRELSQHGLDSSNAFLLDQVPNLVFLYRDSLLITQALESDQKQFFLRPHRQSHGRNGTVAYRYYQDLDDEDNTRYRLSTKLNFSDQWAASFNVHREYSGKERFVNRRVSYRSNQGVLRELSFGSFVTRLGLGTVVGYHGKLLNCSGNLDGESLLSPDNGGFNGIHTRLRLAGLDIQTVGSYIRDSCHELVTVGGMVAGKRGSCRPGLIVASSRIDNRNTGAHLSYLNCGLSVNLRYSGGYNSCEISSQTGATPFTVAVVSEGRHRFDLAEIRYAFWSYGDEFVDLISGSKAGVISRRTELEEVSFEYSNWRAGQEGLLIKSVVQLADDWKFSSGAVVAARSDDVANLELMGSVSHQWTPELSSRVEFLTKERRRENNPTIHTQRARLETRFKSGNLNVRTYIAYAADGADDVHIGLFGSASLWTATFGKLEIWSNLGRIRNGVVEYCYMYIRNEQMLMDNIRFIIKVADSYSRNRSGRHSPVVSLELRASL